MSGGSDWPLVPIVSLAAVAVSTVDKKSYEGEVPVRLVNYTDVYYNDQILPGDYVDATASEEQVRRFSVRAGDVAITKDSETSNDIGIPAFVPKDLPGHVWGYHLAVYRARDPRYGRFLKWFFEAAETKAELEKRTPGVTRVGLGQTTLRYLRVARPDPDEAGAIANYLDRETAEIDAFIADQEQLIALLEERRVASQRSQVLQGLSRGGTRPSGLSWVGQIHEDWEVIALRRLARCRDEVRVPKNAQERAEMTGPFPYWGANSIQGYVDRALISGPLTLVGEDGAPFFDKIAPVAFATDEPIWPNNHVHVLRAGPRITHQYLALYLNTVDYSLFVKGSTRDKLNQSDLMSIPITVPSLAEQRAIVMQLDSETASINAAIADAREAIALSKERRAALISSAVTGRVDATDRKLELV